MRGDEGKELSGFALEGPDGMASWLHLLGGEASAWRSCQCVWPWRRPGASRDA